MKKRLPYPIRILFLLAFFANLNAFAQTYTSVLSSGQFYKVAIAGDGIYKLDASFLSGTAGINLNQTPAQNITLWTNGGGMLPNLNSAPRIDDLKQVAMHGVGMADGKVDAGDYFLFYGEGPHEWKFDPGTKRFHMSHNIYDLNNYYFICVSDRPAMSVSPRPSMGNGDITVTTFDDYQRIETDKVNLLGRFRAPGSGQRWFGDDFSVTRSRSYEMTFPNLVPGSQIAYLIDFAGRSDVQTVVTVDLNGTPVSGTIGSVETGEVQHLFARIIRLNGTYVADDPIQQIEVNYPQVSATSSGWLDFIQLQAVRDLRYEGDPMPFRSVASLGAQTTRYEVAGMSSEVVIWDITDRQQPVQQEISQNGQTGVFVVRNDSLLHEFIAFTPSANFPAPQGIEAVSNQNVHGLTEADLVILYHPDFEEAALRLAQHRLEHNGYIVHSFPIGLIMNEFGGGGQDPTAIRDFARILKSRSSRFKYLILFGDGSYDMRHIHQDQLNDNFIPVFETAESMNPIQAFPSDDYFALLSNEEGDDLKGGIEIAVGRIPVSTPEEAALVVEKIIHYDTSPLTYGDWRLNVTYVADDEDSNAYVNQSEDVSGTQQAHHPEYNVDKIYLDAYPQMDSPGGDRYPDVNAAINTAMQQGMLLLNYFGHGGPGGWTQERVLTTADIQSWGNYSKLPLFITATCSFTPYDEPNIEAAGEMVLLSPSGGAVALLTTVRAVYASSNKRLTSEVFERILVESNGTMTIGEVVILAKNANHADTVDVNARKFAIIGDPSMHIVIPENDLVITSVNGNPAGSGSDTVHALEQVTLGGEVRDKQGNKLTNFQGIVTATVYDKPTKQKTLANDEASYESEFHTQQKVLFKGNATVSNGSFEFTFVVPQDINFKYGNGKVSLYATDGASTDAAGVFTDLSIGGSKPGISDTEGPVIRIYADNESFKDGDETGPNPVMLIRLSDASGINISGTSIGHDLEGVLDESASASYILNDRYVATIDDHTSGRVSLPLSNLKEGTHTFRVVAWDIANNYSEETITFKVVANPDDVISNLGNTPNPVTNETAFSFNHRLGENPLAVEVEIFTVTGRLVAEVLEDNLVSSEGIVEGINWDGSGLSGGRLLPGIYFYRIVATSRPGTASEAVHESKFEKLTLLD